MMCPPGVPYIAVAPVVTSWAVARPTSGVFILYASGMGHADDIPHSDPKGTQFEVPMKGNLNIPLSTSSTTDLRTIKPEVLNLAVA